MSFSPLPLDSSPLRESLLLTPPLSEQNEFRFSNNNTRLSSYSSNSLSSRPDSFMSTSADSTRPLNPTGRSNLLGERRVSNLSNLQYGTGISEQEKSTEDLGLGLTGTEDEAEKGSVLPESFSSGFGDDNTNYNNKLNSRNNSTYSKIMKGRGKWYLLAAIILSIIVIGGAVGATEMKKSNSNLAANTNGTSTISTSSSSSNNGGSTQTGASNPSSTGISRATTGTDGSTVYATDGSTFIYNNTFGGSWNSIPFSDLAQAQSDVPALNKPWDYNNNLIAGVNLGGWLVIEPFIVPGLFEPFEASGTVVDEWTLSVALGRSMAPTISNHYDTFITEKDFAEIAAAGLNWVRIPIPYWAIEVYPGEPFLANVAWTYFLKAIVWARKYGLRINLDFHAVPGSQNGYNHSSKQGSINLLNGVMGIANAQRTLNYIRTLTEFISQPQYSNVIPMFSVLNEPIAAIMGVDTLRSFYIETYNMVRAISGIGEGKGPIIVFSDGFAKSATAVSAGGWNGFLPGSDRVALDQHPYLCFSAPNTDGLSYQASKPCTYWAGEFNSSTTNFGITVGGEWSLAINDCGKWINNVGNGQRYDGTYKTPGNPTAAQPAGVGSCDPWNDWENYTDATKSGLKLVATAHQDALRHSFFWTWKTGFSTTLGKIANPLWNYQLALQQGYMPTNPRAAFGACPSIIAAAGATPTIVAGSPVSAWMTGGAGAGTILNAAQSASYATFPPASIGTNAGALPASFLPTYTATGAISTLAAATPTPTPTPSVDVGNGWNQPLDSVGYFVPVAGCTYFPAWNAVSLAAPAAACTGA